MNHLIGITKNNLEVFVDLFTSAAAKHIAREPRLLTLATEVLRQTSLDQATVDLECDMGRAIGYDFVVETSASDSVFYVQLVRDKVYTRFTKNGEPLATNYLSMALRRDQQAASYLVDDLWIGRFVPPRPGSAEETARSKPYWDDHAFIFSNQPVQSNTLTKTRPY